jgi:hypothetical protein
MVVREQAAQSAWGATFTLMWQSTSWSGRALSGESVRGQRMAKPFYGVDGNLLVDDLPHDHAVVEAILDGRFKPMFWAQQMLPDHLFTKYPQLADEHEKRAHRRVYHAELAVRRQR